MNNNTPSWDEINTRLNGIVVYMTYITLFLNDQTYNHVLMLGDNLKQSDLYRHKPKKLYNDIDKQMRSYNTNIFRIRKVNAELLATVTQNMEDGLKPHIDAYYYAVSQVLLNHEVTGETNRIASIASVVNMLTQVSRIVINDFKDRICRKYWNNYNPIEYLNLDRIGYLADRLSNEIVPKEVEVNLNEQEQVKLALKALMNKLLSRDVLDKAMDIENN